MTQLHQLLAARIKDWRDSSYPAEAYPALAEVLEFQVDGETGALTDANKTDFLVAYKDDHGKPGNYAPDFIIRRKPPAGGRPGSGRAYIVEIKREHDRSNAVDGENGAKAMAVLRWVGLNPDRLSYEMIFTDTDMIPANRLDAVRHWVTGEAGAGRGQGNR